jgi:triosephosphate isomerase
MRIPLIAGNWKMNKMPSEAKTFAIDIARALQGKTEVEVLICPPCTALSSVSEVVKNSKIKLGAQNMHWETRGAFTGEISAEFLKDINCEYVLIGHSERRQLFGETDQTVNKKIHTALKINIKPILCVGETLAERENNKTFEVIGRQISGGLADIAKLNSIVIAYEPVWAIGTGKTATTEQAREVHAFIRKNISDKYGNDAGDELRILYGGSVTPDNIDNLMAQKEIDGALVGGASLKLDSFVRLVNFKT